MVIYLKNNIFILKSKMTYILFCYCPSVYWKLALYGVGVPHTQSHKSTSIVG